MKSAAMLVPTPSKAEITGKIIFSEIIEIEDEERYFSKRPKLDLVESKDKKIKEKGKIQGPAIQIQEYIFVEAQEAISSDKYQSRNDFYTKNGQDKKILLKRL